MKNQKKKLEDNVKDIKKLVVVGDIQCGKTYLLYKIYCDELPEDFFGSYYGYRRDILRKEIILDSRKIDLALWDSSAYEDFERLRPLAYPEADVVLMCYAIDDPKSLENVQVKWHPEIKHHIPYVHCLLIGTKLDVRSDDEGTFVTYEEGFKMSKAINAEGFIECSVKSGIGIPEIREECARIALKSTSKQFYKKKHCAVL